METVKAEMKKVYCDTLLELAKTDDRIVIILSLIHISEPTRP